MITFYLNGEEKSYNGNLDDSLLNYLRNTAGITTVKSGCAPQGACGACTIIIDGKAKPSCTMPMKKIDGKSIITQEGLNEYKKRVFTRAFVEKSGIQCGFCIPGIVMRAAAFLDENSNPSRSDIEKMLHPHICRCTGYKKIIDAF
jgi:aerobic-type carbon monoxide dehydrogenase small subunit (CoxS/CutS family)